MRVEAVSQAAGRRWRRRRRAVVGWPAGQPPGGQKGRRRAARRAATQDRRLRSIGFSVRQAMDLLKIELADLLLIVSYLDGEGLNFLLQSSRGLLKALSVDEISWKTLCELHGFKQIGPYLDMPDNSAAGDVSYPSALLVALCPCLREFAVSGEWAGGQ